MGGPARRYSREFKTNAVRMTIESHRSLTHIARELGISLSTLRRWRRVLEPSLRSQMSRQGGGFGRSGDRGSGPTYSAEFKERALRRVQEGDRPVAEIARELGVSLTSLWRWRLGLDEDLGQPGGASGSTMASEDDAEKAGEATEDAAAVESVEAVEEGEAIEDAAAIESVEAVEEGEAIEEAAAVESVDAVEGGEPLEEAAAVAFAEAVEEAGAEPSGDAVDQDVEPVTGAPEGTRASSLAVVGSLAEAQRSAPSEEAGVAGAVSRTRYPRSSPIMGPPERPPEKPKDTIEVSEVFRILKRRAWLVTATTGLCIAGALVLALRETPTYRATAVLRIGAADREAMTQGFEAPTRDADRYVNPLLSQTQLLRSRSLIRDVVDSVGFRLQPDYSGFGPNLLQAVRVAPDAVADTLWLDFDVAGWTVRTQRREVRARYGQRVRADGVEFAVAGPPSSEQATWTVISREAAVDLLLSQLRISPRAETNIVDVSFLHPDPERARFVVNTLVSLYQQFEAQFAQDRSRRRRVFLEDQVTQTDSGLARARAALRAFQSTAQTYDARQELTSQQENRMVLDIRRGELDAERDMYRRLLDQLASTTGEERWEVLRTLVSAPGIADNTVVSRIHEQLMRQRAVLDSLTTGDFGNAGTNPDVQRQQQLIATSETELTGAIRSHVASLDARAVALQELAQRNAEDLSALPYRLAEEARLEQIVETNETVSDQVRGELQRARVAEAATVGQADIIDLAATPYEPEPGTRVIKLGLGLLLGLTFGLGAAFLQEGRNRVVQTRAEIEGALHLPVLGVIPKATGPDLTELQRRLSPNGTSVVVGRVGKKRTVAASHAMEAFRLLRTNFLFAHWTSDVRSIVVTSTAPREGKTLTSTGLATSIAEEGVRVLLVDADLWRGRIHEMLGVGQSPGLADVLAGKSLASEAICRTGLSGLDFLPRGTPESDPSSLARGTALNEVLTQLGQEYEALVVDAPPVLAAGSAPVLPAVADGVLLLVRAGRTDRRALREAVRELHTVGASLLGVVLNDPENLSAKAEGEHYSRYEYAVLKS